MLTFHTVRKCNTNCLLTAFQQPFNSNFSPWLAVSVGRGVMAPGPLGADGGHTKCNNSRLLPTSNLDILAFVAQPVKGYESSWLADKNWCHCCCVWHFYTLSFVFSSQTLVLVTFPCCLSTETLLVFLSLVTQNHWCLFLSSHLNVSLGLPELQKSLNWLLQYYEKWATLSNGSFSTIAITVLLYLQHI